MMIDVCSISAYALLASRILWPPMGHGSECDHWSIRGIPDLAGPLTAARASCILGPARHA